MTKDEAKRRIELAFAAGEASMCYCRLCGAEAPTSTYRVDWTDEVVSVFCDECAGEHGLL